MLRLDLRHSYTIVALAGLAVCGCNQVGRQPISQQEVAPEHDGFAEAVEGDGPPVPDAPVHDGFAETLEGDNLPVADADGAGIVPGPYIYRLSQVAELGVDVGDGSSPGTVVAGDNGCVCAASGLFSFTGIVHCFDARGEQLVELDSSEFNGVSGLGKGTGFAMDPASGIFYVSTAGSLRFLVGQCDLEAGKVKLISSFKHLKQKGKESTLKEMMSLTLSQNGHRVYGVAYGQEEEGWQVVAVDVQEAQAPHILYRSTFEISPFFQWRMPAMEMGLGESYLYAHNTANTVWVWEHDSTNGEIVLSFEGPISGEPFQIPMGAGRVLAQGPKPDLLLMGGTDYTPGFAMVRYVPKGVDGTGVASLQRVELDWPWPPLTSRVNPVVTLPQLGLLAGVAPKHPSPFNLVVVSVDKASGAVTKHIVEKDPMIWNQLLICEASTSGRNIAFSPDGKRLYVSCWIVGQLGAALLVLERQE